MNLKIRVKADLLRRAFPSAIEQIIWLEKCYLRFWFVNWEDRPYIYVEDEVADIKDMRQLFFGLEEPISDQSAYLVFIDSGITFTIDSAHFTTRNRLYHGVCMDEWEPPGDTFEDVASHPTRSPVCERRHVFLADPGHLPDQYEIGQRRIDFKTNADGAIKMKTKN